MVLVIGHWTALSFFFFLSLYISLSDFPLSFPLSILFLPVLIPRDKSLFRCRFAMIVYAQQILAFESKMSRAGKRNSR